jgi:hypothetical protein
LSEIWLEYSSFFKMHGGARQNAGRKSKADELKLAETIDTALGETWVEDLLKEIHKQAKGGSFPHAQLLLAYKYGKPQDKVDVTTNGKDLPTTKEVVFRDYDKP